MGLILGIESTCDETAAAVVEDGVRVRSSVVATQYALHAKFRGVVPEVASRAHLQAVVPVVREAMAQAGVRPGDLAAVAVAQRPGLIGSLLIGLTAAKALAWAWERPLVAVDHIQAHLYACRLDPPGERASRPVSFPAAGAVLSGGHTALYALEDWVRVTRVGGTIDDALGEAYDKVAATLGLGFPGGPEVARLADEGDPNAVRFPRSLFDRDSLDLSFAGLKTAVLYRALGPKGTARAPADIPRQEKADIAASFQAACLDVVEEKLRRLLRRLGSRTLLLGGGVVSNRALRERLARLPADLHLPHPAYCTDNAAMIAGLGDVLLRRGAIAPLDIDAVPQGMADPVSMETPGAASATSTAGHAPGR
ncbi:MAG: tRNA (adenosine(37)-N6)-threonylcarbamoyltransferase complex transferase subunit TsaD [Tepidisphaerales bacterium]